DPDRWQSDHWIQRVCLKLADRTIATQFSSRDGGGQRKFARDGNDSRPGEIVYRNSLGDWHHDIAVGRLASTRTIIRSHVVGHTGVSRSLVCGADVFVHLAASTSSRSCEVDD